MANILFFHRNAISGNAGGISRMTENLSDLFEKKGHTVFFLSVERRADIRDVNKQLYLPSNELDSDININTFVKILKDNKIDTVINQDAAFSDVSSMLKSVKEITDIKIITCYHNCILTPIFNYHYQQEFKLVAKHLGFVIPFLKLKVVKRFLISLYVRGHRKQYLDTYEISDKIVLLSPGQKEEWEMMTGIKDTKGRIRIIPNCMHIKPYSTYHKKNMVLWVGTIESYIKRPEVLLSIWHTLKDTDDWELVFIGDGSSLSYLKKQTSNWKLKNVRFAGRVESPEEYYKEAKILCVTSAHESFSLVTVEAMMYNMVPILFDSFSMASSLVKDGYNGVLIKPFDKVEYAQKLNFMLTASDTLSRMSLIENESVQKFDLDNVYPLWEKELKI